MQELEIIMNPVYQLYSLIRPPIYPLAFGSGRILIPGFIRSPPTLAAYDVTQSPPLRGAVREFPFIEDETGRHICRATPNSTE